MIDIYIGIIRFWYVYLPQKKANLFETQAKSYIYFIYKRRKYPKENRARFLLL